MDTHHLHLRAIGLVQGVGFRYFVLVQARSLGIMGRVRNRPDGSVEIDAEGPREALEQLLDRVRAGPHSARVEAVETAWSLGPSRHRRFEVSG